MSRLVISRAAGPLVSASLAALLLAGTVHAAPPNFLFIAVDDLRPDLGVYGNTTISTPAIDEIAAAGTVFTEHYVTVPTCGASRHGLLTGRLPRSLDDLHNQASARSLAGQRERETPETFIHHLRRNGYYTVGIGKISHHPDGRVYRNDEPVSDLLELPYSWDEMLFDYGQWSSAPRAFFGFADGSDRLGRNFEVPPYESADVDDHVYPDGRNTDLALRKLRELADRDDPFFLAVGFLRPHLPFAAPQHYWDLYQPEDLPLAPFRDLPAGVARASLHDSVELNRYRDAPEHPTLDKPASGSYARQLIHGYYASISYVDAQVGRLEAELGRLGLADNTIIVIWGDHGWHLGDHRVWGKHTLFDRSLRAPLIVRHPRGSPRRVEQVVSTVDIYPTIVEMAGLPKQPTDGASLAPWILGEGKPETHGRAWSFFRSGVSLRTADHRITRYFDRKETAIELFDHGHDPLETRNIAREQQESAERLERLLLSVEHSFLTR